ALQALERWRERLTGAPTVLELPAERPRPALKASRGALHRFADAELGARVVAFARAAGTTPFAVLATAFAALLHRATGSDDVLFGVPVANRERPETAGLIGLFAGTAVLRSQAADDPSFRTLLERMRVTALDAVADGGVPFESLVEALGVPRLIGRDPLVQVLFALQTPPPPPVLGTVRVAEVELDARAAKVDLTLSLECDEDGLRGLVEYDTDLFEPAEAGRVAERTCVLLRAGLDEPDTPLSRLPLATPAERAWLAALHRREPLPSGPGVVARILARAAERPSEIAVAASDGELSYAALLAASDAFARRLRAAVPPGRRAAILLERGTELVVAIVAALRAGVSYVALDPAYPAERLRLLAEDAACAVVITSAALAGRVPPGARALLVADPAAPPPGPPLPLPRAEDEAYAIYTSGSTGKPKGVLVTHGQLAGLFHALDARFGTPPPGAASVAVTNPTFDVALIDVWMLAAGVRLVLADGALIGGAGLARGGAGSLPALLLRERPHFVQCTPSLAKLLLAQPDGARALGAIDTLTVGGEALAPALAERLAGCGVRNLINAYGPTETTVYATMHLLGGGAEDPVPIGSALDHVTVAVVDGALEEVPPGVIGELAIGGPGVTRGYLGRPGLSAARFVPDPRAAVPGARMYLTGDLARRRADGALLYLGRADGQIKVRGYRVEPGEIEALLGAHPDVALAAVVGTPDNARLDALVVPRGPVDPPALAAALRAAAAAALPPYMVPVAIAVVPELPLGSSGKLDRRAAAALAARLGAAAPAPPAEPVAVGGSDPARTAVAAAWQRTLGTAGHDPHANFFDAGGNSLLAIGLVEALAETFDPAPTLIDVFAHPTIAALAAHLAPGEGEGGAGAEGRARAERRRAAARRRGSPEAQVSRSSR
ncbi:MAG: hypothetical protein QOI11_2027, partial [Candidatus Eremiobacteraeota bacterium]|nr:hypothetical protein [Candidatus Eremiobacteraeota bacterium]